MSDYIPEDNLVQILKNLPVKSLLRFRCVSKLWKDLIDSPSFLQEHLSVQNPRILIHKIDDPELLVVDPHTLSTLPFGYNLRFPHREGSRIYLGNEVRYFLCGAHHDIVYLNDYGSDLLLWNPAIRKFSVLPLPDIGSNLAWNLGWLSGSCVGFWIDPSNREFKFISFKLGAIYDYYDEPMDVDGVLFSSIRHDWRVIPLGEEGKWKPLQELSTKTVGRLGNWSSANIPGPPLMIGRLAYWQGLYWSENEQGHQHNPVEVMLSFDFVQESFEFLEMLFPKCSESLRSIPIQWQGTLSLLYYQCWHETDNRRFDIYSRQGDSWVRMFGFDLRFPIHVAYWALGESEDYFRVLAEAEGGLVLYDSRDGCIPFLGEHFIRDNTCPSSHSACNRRRAIDCYVDDTSQGAGPRSDGGLGLWWRFPPRIPLGLVWTRARPA